MFRDYGDFSGLGFPFALLLMMFGGFILGIFVILADGIRKRFSKNQSRVPAREPGKSIMLMFAAMCSGPVILVLLDLFLGYVVPPVASYAPLLLAVPGSSVMLVAAAGVFAWRDKQVIFLVGCTLMFIVYLYELSLIANLPLPGMR